MRPFILLLLAGGLFACQQQEPPKKFISATSLIEQQVRQIDTSLYAIKRYTQVDTMPTDTAYVSRENFRVEVSDFLQIPDLSDPKQAKSFLEETRFDELTNRVIISYQAIDPKKQPFQTIELFVEPNMATGDQVRTIWAVRQQGDRNGSDEVKMTWQIDKSCSRTRITQKPGGSMEVKTIKWSWND